MAYAINPIISGVDLDRVDSSRAFPLGAIAYGSDGATYQYVQNNLSATAGRYLGYIIDESFKLTAAWGHSNGGSGANPLPVGVPQTSNTLTDQYYFWVIRKGPVTVQTSAAVAADVQVFTSATVGMVDDTSTSQTMITGLYMTASVTAASTAASAFASVEMSLNCYTKASAS